MTILEQKQEIFGNIAALRTLNEGYPTLNISNSIPSINNGKNSLDFLTDLLKSLVGFEEIKSVLVNTLSYEMEGIEEAIKSTLKSEIKGFVNCGVNPSLPPFLQHSTVNSGSTGVQLEVRKFDINDIFLVEPTSDLGVMYYSDVNSGINSTDFNTFLNNTIQTPNTEQLWGSSTLGTNILSVEFNDVASPNNNVIKVTASPTYSNGSKSLTDLNNDFIDSIKLFNTKEIIPNIIDSIFGSVSLEINKSRNQIEKEVIFEQVINSIINTDEDDVITDEYFVFNTDIEKLIEKTVREKREGRVILDTCSEVKSEIPVSQVVKFSNELSASTSTLVTNQIIINNINNLSDISAENASDGDKYNIKLNFIESLLKKLMNSIANTIFGPKMIFLFAWNHQIVHGLGNTFVDPIDFLKQNKSLMRNILNGLRDAVINVILKEVLNKISDLVAQNFQNILIERARNQQAQILSLVGVPQDIIRTIQNLT